MSASFPPFVAGGGQSLQPAPGKFPVSGVGIRVVFVAAAVHARLVFAGGMLAAAAMHARFVLAAAVRVSAAIGAGFVLAAAVLAAAAMNAEHGDSPLWLRNVRLECCRPALPDSTRVVCYLELYGHHPCHPARIL